MSLAIMLGALPPMSAFAEETVSFEEINELTENNADNLLDDVAVEPESHAVSMGRAETDAAMKFEQTAFDEDTGILSMTLKVKKQTTVTNQYYRNFNGAFAFSYDSTTVRLLTNPNASSSHTRTEFPVLGSDNISYVADIANSNQLKLFDSSKGMGVYDDAMSVARDMSATIYTSTGDFDEPKTAVFVSGERAEELGGAKADMVDCYFQYQFGVLPTPDANGYYEVLTLDFQVEGNSTEGLYANSFRVPQTKAESDELMQYFYYTEMVDNGGELVPGARVQLGMSSAAYGEVKRGQLGIEGLGKYYYNYDEVDLKATLPTVTAWSSEGTRTGLSTWDEDAYEGKDEDGINAIAGAPYVWFENSEKEYIITELIADENNVYSTSGAGDYDFLVPAGQTGEFPRYSVPKSGEEPDENSTNWIPNSYTGSSVGVKRVPLKYFVDLGVTSNSVSKPTENPEKLTNFMNDDMEWEFAVDNTGTLLKDLDYELTSEKHEIMTKDGKATATIAKITDQNPGYEYLEGTKLQVVTWGEGVDAKEKVTPMGITLDMLPSIVSSLELDGQTEFTVDPSKSSYSPLAPQLNVKSYASREENYIWTPVGGIVGNVYIAPSFTDDKNTKYEPDSPIVLRMYKDGAIATALELDLSSMGEVSLIEETRVRGVYVETNDDPIKDLKIPVFINIYDQYGMIMNSATRLPKVQLKAKDEEFLPKAMPLELIAVPEEYNKYLLSYKTGKWINDLPEQWEFSIEASYLGLNTSDWEDEDKSFYVTRELNEFAYMKIQASETGNIDPEEVEVVNVKIPERKLLTNEVTESNIYIYIQELANQWRDVNDSTQNIYNFDVEPGIREKVGSEMLINRTKAAEKNIEMDFAFNIVGADIDPTNRDGIKLKDATGTSPATITIDSTVKDKTEVELTVTGTYKRGTAQEKTHEKKYKFIFSRSTDRQVNTITFNDIQPISVPTEKEGVKEIDITPIARDRYNAYFDWIAIYAINNDGIKYSMNLRGGGALPSGVTLRYDDAQNKTFLVVQPTAQSSTITLYSTYKVVTSKDVTIEIKKADSVPTEIVTMTYENSGIMPAPYTEDGSVDSEMPVANIVVKDQFGAIMSPSNYQISYEIVATATNPNPPEGLEVTVGTGKAIAKAGKIVGGEIISSSAKAGKASVRVTVRTKDGGKGTTKTFQNAIEVRREANRISKVSISPNKFVEMNNGIPEEVELYEVELKKNTQLNATGYNQYGEKIDNIANLSWTLESVLYKDQKEIPSYGSNKYTTRSLEMTTAGYVTFIDRPNPDDRPISLEVSAVSGGNTSTKGSETFTIRMEEEKLKPKDITLITDVSSAIIVPTGDNVVNKTLTAYVVDGYGVRDTSAVIDWTDYEIVYPQGVEDDKKQGVSFDPATATVTVDSRAFFASVVIKAKHQPVGSDAIVKEITIVIEQDGDSNPSGIIINGIEVESGTYSKDLTLPDLSTINFSGGVNIGNIKYSIKATVVNQYGLPMAGQVVTWEITTASQPFVVLPSSQASDVEIRYTDDARDAYMNGTPKTFKLKATHKDVATYPSAVSEETEFTIVLDKPVPTYAIPKITSIDPGYLDPLNPKNSYVNLPRKGEYSRAEYDSIVRDQYGRIISTDGAAGTVQEENAGDSIAILNMTTNTAGLAFNSVEGTGVGTATSNSMTTARIIRVRGVPMNNRISAKDMPATTVGGEKLDHISEVPLKIDENSRYAYELSLGTIQQVGDDLPVVDTNDYQLDIPTWDTDGAANVPNADMAYEKKELDAIVIDQYGKESATHRPRWKFAETYKGISFDGTANNYIDNKHIGVNVDHQSLGKDELEKVISLNLVAVNMTGTDESTDELLKKSINVTLNKGRSIPTYMYVDGVDENGVLKSGIPRPTEEKKSETVKITPVVYDQYGYVTTGEGTRVDLVEESITEQGALVERIYKKSTDEEDGIPPIKYEIYTSEMVNGREVKTDLGFFDVETEELTIYTICTLSEFRFVAKTLDTSGPLAGIEKRVKVNLVTETIRPTRMDVEGDQKHSFLIYGTERDNLAEISIATVYDQYGQVYPLDIRKIRWELKSIEVDPNTGEPLEYEELDENELPLPEDSYKRLVLLSNGKIATSGQTTVIVQPKNFKNNVTFQLKATLVTSGNVIVNPELSLLTKVTIRRYVPSPPGGGGAPENYVVTYKEGEHGKLMGDAIEVVIGGESPRRAPGVKSEKGYAHVGWTYNDKQIDIKTFVVGDNIELVAKYQYIVDLAFVNGYEDNTVRPDALVSRAEFVKMLVEAVGGYDPEIDYGDSYRDVGKNKWYANYIAYGKRIKIIDGYNDGTFHPEETITRAEGAKLIYGVLEDVPEFDGTSNFKDVQGTEWFAQSVEALYSLGIINGYEDGTFRPSNNIYRKEAIKMIVMISRIAPTEEELENIKLYADSPFRDLERKHWAYAYILRAAGVA